MKIFMILCVIFIAGCNDSSKRILKAEITGKKYTVFTCSGDVYKINDYHIQNSTGVMTFYYKDSEYKLNCWTLKATKV